MNYIVLDLEWNQSNTGEEAAAKKLPFEIIEIGAVKMNEKFEILDHFHRLIKPSVYREMHHITKELIHLDMEDLNQGNSFPGAAGDFLKWCGEDRIFCTWGPGDLTELQRNMRFYQMDPLFQGPAKYYDVQKLFSIQYEDKKVRKNLEYAVDFLKIERAVPFHRAFGDAYYTARVLAGMTEQVLKHYSYDTFHPPKRKEDEVRVVFDTYAKYISREFENKMAALNDREVVSVKCYLCRKNIKRKIKWFTGNNRYYYSVGHCSVHGHMKSKLRIRKLENGNVYAVKTMKFISEEEAELIKKRKR